MHRSLLNGDGGRELDSAEPHNNTFEIDELSRLTLVETQLIE